MASITLNVNIDNAPVESLTQKGKQQALNVLDTMVKGLASGTVKGSIDIHTSTANPVAAAGSVVITNANVSNNDTLTIGGVVLTAKTSGANGTSEFNIGGSATLTGDNLVACIAANTTLSPHIVASNASGTVTITAKLKGSIGNLIVMSTSDGTAFALTQLTGGTGGPASTATSY